MWSNAQTFELDLNQAKAPWELELAKYIENRYREPITIDWWPNWLIAALTGIFTLGLAARDSFWYNLGVGRYSYDPVKKVISVSIPWRDQSGIDEITFDQLPVGMDLVISRLDMGAALTHHKRRRALKALGLNHYLLPGSPQPGTLQIAQTAPTQGQLRLADKQPKFEDVTPPGKEMFPDALHSADDRYYYDQIEERDEREQVAALQEVIDFLKEQTTEQPPEPKKSRYPGVPDDYFETGWIK